MRDWEVNLYTGRFFSAVQCTAYLSPLDRKVEILSKVFYMLSSRDDVWYH